MSFENQIPARHMINPSAIGFMATIKRQPLILGNEYRHDGGCDVSSKSSLTVGGAFDDGGGPSVASPGIQTFIQVCILFLNYAELWIPGDAADVSVTSVVVQVDVDRLTSLIDPPQAIFGGINSSSQTGTSHSRNGIYGILDRDCRVSLP